MIASIGKLDQAIQEELKEWSGTELQKALNEGIKETADEAAKMLKKGGPYEERTGKYTKGWTSGVRSNRASAVTGLEQYSVYNRKHPQLTHLLEKGHQSRKGGRVKSFEHIKPVSDQIGDMAAEKIARKVGR